MASARAVPPFATTPLLPSGEYEALIMYLAMVDLFSVADDLEHNRKWVSSKPSRAESDRWSITGHTWRGTRKPMSAGALGPACGHGL